MTEPKIEPALTEKEWADARSEYPFNAGVHARYLDVAARDFKGEFWPAVIAIANAALPDSNPRKITHLDIEAIRETARVQQAALSRAIGPVTDNYIERLERIAAALESYLPL